MSTDSIMRRLKELERKSEAILPIVFAEYQYGDTAIYRGLPPMDHIFREVNPIVRTWGSDFANMVNELLHPAPNRHIEDFEEG